MLWCKVTNTHIAPALVQVIDICWNGNLNHVLDYDKTSAGSFNTAFFSEIQIARWARQNLAVFVMDTRGRHLTINITLVEHLMTLKHNYVSIIQ